MKKLLIAGIALIAVVASAEYKSYEDELLERLKPAGNVCIAGESCATATVSTTMVASGPRSGEEVYGLACAACHASGVLNSPMLGDIAAWTPRQAKGAETLYLNAINGINAMPARGGNASLTDAEVSAAVDYILASLE